MPIKLVQKECNQAKRCGGELMQLNCKSRQPDAYLWGQSDSDCPV